MSLGQETPPVCARCVKPLPPVWYRALNRDGMGTGQAVCGFCATGAEKKKRPMGIPG